MENQLVYDISTQNNARKTLEAIVMTRHGNNPHIAIDDDMLYVESQINPRNWDLNRTTFNCYVQIECEFDFPHGNVSATAKRKAIRCAIENALHDADFYLYNQAFRAADSSLRKTETGKLHICKLCRATIAYKEIKQIDDVVTPGSYQDFPTQKKYLLSYVTEALYSGHRQESVPISLKAPIAFDRLRFLGD